MRGWAAARALGEVGGGPRFTRWFAATLISAGILLVSGQAQAILGSASLTLADVYGSGPGGILLTIGIAAALAIGAGVAFFLSGGTATPAIAAVGTFLGNMAGLSGAAATNYGLALIGGGAVAAGGYGVAGGAAVLAALMSFSSTVAFDLAVAQGLASFNARAFKEQSKHLVTLPFPTRENGSASYDSVVAKLGGTYNSSEPRHSVENRGVVAVSLRNVETTGAASLDEVKNLSLRALLNLHADDYDACDADASSALHLAAGLGIAERRTTFPLMLKATCMLGVKQTTRENLRLAEELFHKAVATEIEGKFNDHLSIFVAGFLDRFFSREDLVSAGVLRSAISFLPVIEEPEARYAYFMLLAPRFNYELNQVRSMVEALHQNRGNPTVAGRKDAKADMRHLGTTYRELLTLAEDFTHYARTIDPSRNFMWGTRWYRKEQIKEQADALALLATSIEQHAASQHDVERMVAAFTRGLPKS